MANILPAEGMLNMQYNMNITANADAVDVFDPSVVPTDEVLIRENRRFFKIEHAQERDGVVGGLTDGEYSSAIIRHQKVLSTRLGNTNDALALQLTQIQNQLGQNQQTQAQIQNQLGQNQQTQAQIQNQLAQIQAQIQNISNDMNRRFDLMAACLSATNARSFNAIYLDHIDMEDVWYRPIVKYTAGHPVIAVPDVPNVQFQPEYEVGSEPPDGLIPRTLNEIKRLDLADNLVTLRRRLRAIYWFYNEPVLELDAHASLNACRLCLSALGRFLKFP